MIDIDRYSLLEILNKDVDEIGKIIQYQLKSIKFLYLIYALSNLEKPRISKMEITKTLFLIQALLASSKHNDFNNEITSDIIEGIIALLNRKTTDSIQRQCFSILAILVSIKKDLSVSNFLNIYTTFQEYNDRVNYPSLKEFITNLLKPSGLLGERFIKLGIKEGGYQKKADKIQVKILTKYHGNIQKSVLDTTRHKKVKSLIGEKKTISNPRVLRSKDAVLVKPTKAVARHNSNKKISQKRIKTIKPKIKSKD